jgi:hypothetical protein
MVEQSCKYYWVIYTNVHSIQTELGYYWSSFAPCDQLFGWFIFLPNNEERIPWVSISSLIME